MNYRMQLTDRETATLVVSVARTNVQTPAEMQNDIRTVSDTLAGMLIARLLGSEPREMVAAQGQPLIEAHFEVHLFMDGR